MYLSRHCKCIPYRMSYLQGKYRKRLLLNRSPISTLALSFLIFGYTERAEFVDLGGCRGKYSLTLRVIISYRLCWLFLTGRNNATWPLEHFNVAMIFRVGQRD